MKKLIFLLVSVVLFCFAICFVIFYQQSTLSIADGTVAFQPLKHGMNQMTITAPYGTFVIHYSVVPTMNDKQPFKSAGAGHHFKPTGFFDTYIIESNMYPSHGIVEHIPLDTHVQVSRILNAAATAQLPDDKRILEKCGTYVIITKDSDMHNKIKSIVENWSLENGPWTQTDK